MEYENDMTYNFLCHVLEKEGRPRKNILLQEDEHLFIYVIGENIGPLPDVTIDRDHISFSIKADIFTIV